MKKFLTGIALFLIFILPVTASAQTLIPGGFLIGIHLKNDTLTVSQVHRTCDLKPGDQLLKIDDTPIRQVDDISAALENCENTVTVTVRRNGKLKTVTVAPEDKKLGITLKNGVSGLGTVTYYDPQTKKFGALGHSVNDQSGAPISLTEGSVYPASVVSVQKGSAGKPGRLLGQLDGSNSLGTVEKIVTRGIFGKADFRPDQPLPVATRQQVHTGPATIRCTVDGRGLQEYSVEILRLYPENNSRTRDLLLRVTDEALLETTGGIVQGMSGSPIIQDGKLIGAVTHVLVNDPTTGYGIFIENMLDAAA